MNADRGKGGWLLFQLFSFYPSLFEGPAYRDRGWQDARLVKLGDAARGFFSRIVEFVAEQMLSNRCPFLLVRSLGLYSSLHFSSFHLTTALLFYLPLETLAYLRVRLHCLKLQHL